MSSVFDALRKYLGICTETDVNEREHSAATSEVVPEVLLIGHDLRNDFKAMSRDDIKLSDHLRYTGCVDTHIIAEDNGSAFRGLSDMMEIYGIAQCHAVQTQGAGKKRVFAGAHNAGNDAIATLKVLLAQVLNTNIGRTSELEGGRQQKPLSGADRNLILLAYDTEVVESSNYIPWRTNRTTEHEFAWLRLDELAGIAPGTHGKDWHPFIQARHWINEEWRRFENKLYIVGNRDGFWPEYGRSEYYRGCEGPAPFHAFFKQLATGPRVSSIVTHVHQKKERIVEVEPIDAIFSSLAITPRSQSDALRPESTRAGVKASSEGVRTESSTVGEGRVPIDIESKARRVSEFSVKTSQNAQNASQPEHSTPLRSKVTAPVKMS